MRLRIRSCGERETERRLNGRVKTRRDERKHNSRNRWCSILHSRTKQRDFIQANEQLNGQIMRFIDMDDDNDDSMASGPEIFTRDFSFAVPMLTAEELSFLMDQDFDSTADQSSADESEQPSLKRDQRRVHLLNNPDYGIILDFLEKFRASMNIQNYPLYSLENDLLSEQKNLNQRFLDFHLLLLKKVLSGKTVPKDQFLTIITRFAYRFNDEDGEDLEKNGYAQSSIDTKVRVLKNLLEKQFDRNVPFRNTLIDKVAFELRSQPFGRDRFGASYWLFLDNKCFLRLFRENVDSHRTWMNLAKNREELENLIKLLITDHVVRKKFPGWNFSYEPFDKLSPSNEFEDRHTPHLVESSDSSATNQESIPSLSSNSSVYLYPTTIKTENIDLHPVVNLDRQLPVSPPLSCHIVQDKKPEDPRDIESDQGSINSSEINPNRLSPRSCSNDTNEDASSVASLEDAPDRYPMEDTKSFSTAIPEQPTESEPEKKNEAIIESKALVVTETKRRLVDYDDTESEVEEEPRADSPLEVAPPKVIPKSRKKNEDLPIALRRTRRGRRLLNSEHLSSSSSSAVSLPRTIGTRRSAQSVSHESSEASRYHGRSRRSSARRTRKSVNDFSSTTTEENPTSDEDDLSADFLINNELNHDELYEEEVNDNDDIPTPRAKTVAKLRASMSTDSSEESQLPLIACRRCTQTDRTDSLLLCETCDDAYHLECAKPALLAVPRYEWHCELCEHKRLCVNLIEKLMQMKKDDEHLQMKRQLMALRRKQRSANVRVPVPVPVPVPAAPVARKVPPKRRVNTILSTDEEEEEQKKIQPAKKYKTFLIDDYEEIESVAECQKPEESAKVINPVVQPPQPQQQQQEAEEEPGKRQLRACRRQTKDYRCDDFDTKMTEAIIDTGLKSTQDDMDSDATEIMSDNEKKKIQRLHDELDNDFDGSDGRDDQDDDFVPFQARSMDDDSRTAAKENTQYDLSDATNNGDLNRKKRNSSTSSAPKRKPNPKPRANRRKTKARSEEDNIRTYHQIEKRPSDELSSLRPVDITVGQWNISPLLDLVAEANSGNIPPAVSVNPKSKIVDEKDELAAKSKPRRQRRAPAKKKRESIQQENISEDEDPSLPPPARRLPQRQRSGSNDSFVADDDDYEKLAHKRRLFNHGKVSERRSILNHIKKLVGDEDDEEDGDGQTGETNGDENGKQKHSSMSHDEYVVSDDDDFPDEQEILKTTNLANLKKSLQGTKAAVFRSQFMPPVQSYQFAMMDPTAHVDFLFPPEEPIGEPSDSNQINSEQGIANPTAEKT